MFIRNKKVSTMIRVMAEGRTVYAISPGDCFAAEYELKGFDSTGVVKNGRKYAVVRPLYSSTREEIPENCLFNSAQDAVTAYSDELQARIKRYMEGKVTIKVLVPFITDNSMAEYIHQCAHSYAWKQDGTKREGMLAKARQLNLMVH